MALKVMKATDAMILGIASRNPDAAKKHIEKLSKPDLKTVGRFFVTGKTSQAVYEKNKLLVEGLIEFSGIQQQVVKKKTGPVQLKRTSK